MVKSWQEVVIVSEELPEEVLRWTAKRRSALTVSIIRGETSVQEAAVSPWPRWKTGGSSSSWSPRMRSAPGPGTRKPRRTSRSRS